MKNIAPAGALAALALALASCAAPAPAPASSVAAASSQTAPSSSPSSPVTSSAAAAPTSDASSAAGDLAGQVQTAVSGIGHVKGVKSPEEGRVEISTDLKDPGNTGSADTQTAVKICETASKVPGVTYVNVTETDGTSWVLFGHPRYPAGECTVA